MGAAKRRGSLNDRIEQATKEKSLAIKKGKRFVHLFRFISPRATRDSIIACGKNRGLVITNDMGLPPIKYKERDSALLPYLMMNETFASAFYLYRR